MLMSSPWAPSITSLFGAVACSTPPTRMSAPWSPSRTSLPLRPNQQIAGRAGAQDVGVVEVLLRRHVGGWMNVLAALSLSLPINTSRPPVSELERCSGGAGSRSGDDEEEENESAVSAE
jgi:hypothetical protein